MKTGQAGINLIKQFEGCRLEAYKCPAGRWTIGYGHTANVKQGDKISQTQADAFLKADLEKYEKCVEKYNNKYSWSQDEFDALVSFAYNLGSIDQLVANGTRDRATIAEKMLLYNKAAGKVLAGLTKRREAERSLFLSGGSASTSTTTTRATVKYGSRGADVTYLQECLNKRSYSVGSVDGIFGYKTLAAVKAFQADNGLSVDGIVGPKTWDALA